MYQPLLTVFANFHIDNSERFKRMRDSFKSFYKINPNQFVINIRGKFKYQAGKFLKEKIKKNLELSYLNSTRGWMYDSRNISKKIKSNYVFYWIEDHILVSSPQDLLNCIREMEKYKVNQLQYSFLHAEMRKTWAIPKDHKKGKYIKVINLNSKSCSMIRNKIKNDFYAVSAVTIFEKNFFLKVLFSKKPILKRWPRHLPFDFEKKSLDKISSNISLAVPHKELFVEIDDDHENPGYSLISRKKYPNRISRKELMDLEFNNIKQSYAFITYTKFKILIKKNIFLSKFVINFLYLIKRIFYTINLYGNKK